MKYKTEQSQPRRYKTDVLYTKPQTSLNIPEVTLFCQQEGGIHSFQGQSGTLREPQSWTSVLTTNCLITAEAMLKTPSKLPQLPASENRVLPMVNQNLKFKPLM